MDDFRYLAQKGYKLMRLPIRWERMQPVNNKALDATYVAAIKEVCADAASVGMLPIIDIHNYGGRYFANGTHAKIGTKQLPVSAFVDLWSRMALAFKGNPNVYGFDLMNEPGDPPAIQAEAGLPWQDASRRAVNAIRNQKVGKLISILSYYKHGQGTGTGLPKFTQIHADCWITDSNFLYTAHWYCDNEGIRPPNGSGPGSDGTYDVDKAYWAARGY